MLGTHYPCSRAVGTGPEHGPWTWESFWTSVNTGHRDGQALLLTRHRASTGTRWHFAFGGCHSNETRTLIANPPNSAQLESILAISPTYIRVRAVVRECGEGQTDTQTDTVTHRRPWSIIIIHFASATPHAKCNNRNIHNSDSDVISSYHIYASCFPAMMWGKLWEMFVIVIAYHFLSKIVIIRTFS